MDGFLTDYIQHLPGRDGPPTHHDEYAQFMTGYTPEQMPVLSTLAPGSPPLVIGSARPLLHLPQPVVLPAATSAAMW